MADDAEAHQIAPKIGCEIPPPDPDSLPNLDRLPKKIGWEALEIGSTEVINQGILAQLGSFHLSEALLGKGEPSRVVPWHHRHWGDHGSEGPI